MKKIYHLSTCTTCQRILKEINNDSSFELQDIKTNKITPNQLNQMAKMAGSYESLFSKRAIKYKSMGLKDKDLSEADFRQLILDEYTFLKRPVVLLENNIYVGNAKKTIELIKQNL